MTRRDGRRGLTGEDRELWRRFSEGVTPLDKTAPAPPPRRRAKAEPADEPKPDRAKAPARAAGPDPQAPAAIDDGPPLAGFDRRFRRRVASGRTEVDARLDLHGLTQAAAHQRLKRFLAGAQASGHRVVLVITGKGGDGTGTGVLKRVVPQWLALAEFRRLVVGFEPAHRAHGGEGALYIRVRRKAGR